MGPTRSVVLAPLLDTAVVTADVCAATLLRSSPVRAEMVSAPTNYPSHYYSGSLSHNAAVAHNNNMQFLSALAFTDVHVIANIVQPSLHNDLKISHSRC